MNWLEKLRDEAQRPPAQPRMPLLWNGQVIGTVAQGFLDTVGVDCLLGQRIVISQKKKSQVREFEKTIPYIAERKTNSTKKKNGRLSFISLW